jgi:hypothetical protein
VQETNAIAHRHPNERISVGVALFTSDGHTARRFVREVLIG